MSASTGQVSYRVHECPILYGPVRFVWYYSYMKKKIIIGLDFDGVVAYNPLRIVRAPITYIKRTLFRSKKIKFYIPKSPLEKLLFYIPHQLSIFPGFGMNMLTQLVKKGIVEAHLISGRYSYLDSGLRIWLKNQDVEKIFTSIHTNTKDEQPHLFKEKVIRDLELDYFIEDNLDIVQYLTPRVDTNVLWIYNIFDRNVQYENKYPYMKKALEDILTVSIDQ